MIVGDRRWHRWSLRSSVGKATCPQCGHKHRLSPYWDHVEGVKMDVGVYGLCDRVSSCGFHWAPWMDKKDEVPYYYRPVSYVEPERVHLDRDAYYRNTVRIDESCCHLAGTLGAEESFAVYGCRTEARNPSLVYYPYVNRDGHIRAIAGHRYRAGKFSSSGKLDWYHKRHAVPDGYLKQDRKVDCLFGEHLLASRPDRKVGIVEGPKTAILCNMYLGGDMYNWLATFNQQSIYRDLKLFAKFRSGEVLVIPDKDSVGYWSEVVHDANKLYINVVIRCIDIRDRLVGDESDVGDYLFRVRDGFSLD